MGTGSDCWSPGHSQCNQVRDYGSYQQPLAIRKRFIMFKQFYFQSSLQGNEYLLSANMCGGHRGPWVHSGRGVGVQGGLSPREPPCQGIPPARCPALDCGDTLAGDSRMQGGPHPPLHLLLLVFSPGGWTQDHGTVCPKESQMLWSELQKQDHA